MNVPSLFRSLSATPSASLVALAVGLWQPKPFAQTDGQGEPPEMVSLPRGAFQMGSPPHEPGRLPDEARHQVKLTRPYSIGRTEVTWSLWNQVRDWALDHGYSDLSVGSNGFSGEGGDHPVTEVSWWDVIYWCNARSEMEGREPVYYHDPGFRPASLGRRGIREVYAKLQANGYRLPTEAEWEHACRAGTQTAFYSGDIAVASRHCLFDPHLDKVGWYCGNSESNTHPAGKKAANAFALQDMHGNAAEWCWDWYGPYGDDQAVDPTGPEEGGQRIIRGGSWFNPARQARAAYRHALAPATVFYNLGFRLAATGER